MSGNQFLTIAGRWRQHVQAGGLDKVMPKEQQRFAMLMFYAGFGAALEAANEVAAFPEGEAMQLLSALHQEFNVIANVALAAAPGTRPN
jgi:hypothetical protein